MEGVPSESLREQSPGHVGGPSSELFLSAVFEKHQVVGVWERGDARERIPAAISPHLVPSSGTGRGRGCPRIHRRDRMGVSRSSTPQ